MGGTTIEHQPVDPITEIDAWSAHLTRMATQPLGQCEQFPKIAARFEAWWHQAIVDRPILVGATNTVPERPLGRRLELLQDPENWLENKKRDMAQLHRVGEALPHVRVDFGPVMLGQMFSPKTEHGSDTTWTHAFINDDWSNLPDFEITENTRWWGLLKQLLDLAAEDAAGQHLVCTPDLGGSADVLLNLRGPEALCLDAIEQPDRLVDAQERLYPAWRKAFSQLYRSICGAGAGLLHWLGIWSNRPYIVPACDFNFMIGPEDFERTCLPDIARQVATVGRGVFHLDGSGASRHYEALCEVPGMKAIQYTTDSQPGSGMQFIEMFQAIQARGKSLYIAATSDEVLDLAKNLKPEGLAIWLKDGPPREKLDQLFEAFVKLW